jgi:HSP20 family protein
MEGLESGAAVQVVASTRLLAESEHAIAGRTRSGTPSGRRGTEIEHKALTKATQPRLAVEPSRLVSRAATSGRVIAFRVVMTRPKIRRNVMMRKGEALSPIRREMERMFDDLGRRWRPSWMMEEEEGDVVPAVEVSESDDEVLVKAQLPGMKKDDIQVELSDGGLTIQGEAKEEKEEKKKNYYRREFSYGRFSRRIGLPRGVDTSKASAELKDGILNVHLPKTEEARKKSVQLTIQ